MIQYTDSEYDRVTLPEGISPTDDVLIHGANLPVLERIERLLTMLLATTRRAGLPNPTLIDLSPGVIFHAHVRMRPDLLITSGPGSDELAVKIGAANTFKWFSAASAIVLPLPIVFDRGTDIQVVDITTPSSTAWTAYVLAYPELEVPSE